MRTVRVKTVSTFAIFVKWKKPGDIKTSSTAVNIKVDTQEYRTTHFFWNLPVSNQNVFLVTKKTFF